MREVLGIRNRCIFRKNKIRQSLLSSAFVSQTLDIAITEFKLKAFFCFCVISNFLFLTRERNKKVL